ncbi:hypothetical protein SESBI_30656 [Sesbania bispinosa]|nr:hypothetical protein SESBI_30656 [Sesbania bispinosa]
MDKGVKDNIRSSGGHSSMCWDAQKLFRSDAMKEIYWKMVDLDGNTVEEFNVAREKALKELRAKEGKEASERAPACEPNENGEPQLRDLVCARHKGANVASTSSTGMRVKRTTKCGYYRVVGHNRVTCSLRA